MLALHIFEFTLTLSIQEYRVLFYFVVYFIFSIFLCALSSRQSILILKDTGHSRIRISYNYLFILSQIAYTTFSKYQDQLLQRLLKCFPSLIFIGILYLQCEYIHSVHITLFPFNLYLVLVLQSIKFNPHHPPLCQGLSILVSEVEIFSRFFKNSCGIKELRILTC